MENLHRIAADIRAIGVPVSVDDDEEEEEEEEPESRGVRNHQLMNVRVRTSRPLRPFAWPVSVIIRNYFSAILCGT